MASNYNSKILLMFVCALLLALEVNAQELKLLIVDPASDTVTIKNFGTETQNIGNYRLCSKRVYRTMSDITVVSGTLELAPNAEVTVESSGFLDDTSADLGLYLPSGSFELAENMIDFTQWGSGGNVREDVAVTAGIWTAGTFINVEAPYEFSGGGQDFGLGFWDSLLNVKKLNKASSFEIFTNPSNSILNIRTSDSRTNLSLEVFDILGKKTVYERFKNGQLPQVNISNWPSGLYLIKISNGLKYETKRFIKR